MTGFYLTRDGRPVSGRVYPSDNGVLVELHRVQSMSFDWAIRYEGYGVGETEADVWPADEARELARTARRMMRDHGDPEGQGHRNADDMTRENCGACALAGYGASDEEGPLGPNYAGWARVYVQSGTRVPPEWHEAFLAELATPDSARYVTALSRDIRTFGTNAPVPAEVLA
jgi:hypothetical protein